MINNESCVTQSFTMSSDAIELNLKVSGVKIPKYTPPVNSEVMPAPVQSAIQKQALSTIDSFLEQVLHIEARDVNLKFIFENVKNYMISAGVIAAGIFLLKEHTPQYFKTAIFTDSFLGVLLITLGYIFYILNLVHLLLGVAKLTKQLKIHVVWLFIICYLAFLASAGLVMATIFISKG